MVDDKRKFVLWKERIIFIRVKRMNILRIGRIWENVLLIGLFICIYIFENIVM